MNKSFFLICISLIMVLLISCDKIPSSKEGYAEPPEDEQEFITYFEKSQKNLAPIEGVYFIDINDTVYNKEDNVITGIAHESFIGYIYKSQRTDELPNLYDIVIYKKSPRILLNDLLYLPHALSHPIGSDSYNIIPRTIANFNIFPMNRFDNIKAFHDFYVNLFIESERTLTRESLHYKKIFPL